MKVIDAPETAGIETPIIEQTDAEEERNCFDDGRDVRRHIFDLDEPVWRTADLANALVNALLSERAPEDRKTSPWMGGILTLADTVEDCTAELRDRYAALHEQYGREYPAPGAMSNRRGTEPVAGPMERLTREHIAMEVAVNASAASPDSNDDTLQPFMQRQHVIEEQLLKMEAASPKEAAAFLNFALIDYMRHNETEHPDMGHRLTVAAMEQALRMLRRATATGKVSQSEQPVQ